MEMLDGINQATRSEPALYLFVLAALYGLRLIVNSNKETAETFRKYVVDQDLRQDARDLESKRRATECHSVQTSMIERFIAHAKESDARRDAALDKQLAAFTEAALVIKSVAAEHGAHPNNFPR